MRKAKVHLTKRRSVKLINVPGTSVTGTKKWEFEEDVQHDNASEVSLTLNINVPFMGLKAVPGATPSWDGDKYVFNGIEKYDASGNELQYIVTENRVVGYHEPIYMTSLDTVYSLGTPSGGVIVNLRMKGTLQVNKIWDDSNNHDGKRQAATIKLQKKIGEEGSWTDVEGKTGILAEEPTPVQFSGLPVYEGGEIVYYRVVEEPLDGYTATYDAGDNVFAVDGAGVDLLEATDKNKVKNKTITVKNYHKKELVRLKVKKEWNDSDNQDGIRPNGVEVCIIQDGEPAVNFEGILYSELYLSEYNQWESYIDVPKYRFGKELEYSVEEVKDAVITGTDGPGTYSIDISGNTASGFTVTNTHTPQTVVFNITKNWDDEYDRDGLQKETTINIYKKINGIQETEPYRTITVEKGDKTNPNHFDNGLGRIAVPLGTVELPMYDQGQAITYIFEEEPVEGYTTAATAEDNLLELIDEGTKVEVPTTVIDDQYYFYNPDIGIYITFTNLHTPEKRNIKVTKAWEDGNNAKNLRPGAIGVILKDGDNQEVEYVRLNKDNDWTHTFTVNKYKDGVEIDYSVAEVALRSAVAGDELIYVKSVSGDMTNGFVLTNTLVRSIGFTKVWDDNNDAASAREDAVIRLKKNIAGVESTVDGASDITISKDADDANRSDGWIDLPVYSGTDEIEYSVVEIDGTREKVDGDTLDSGYAVSIAGTMSGGFTVTNSLGNDTVDVSLTKTWHLDCGETPVEWAVYDDNSMFGFAKGIALPDAETFAQNYLILKADGVDVTDKYLSNLVIFEDPLLKDVEGYSEWMDFYTWVGLPKSSGGVDIEYTVEEKTPPAKYTKGDMEGDMNNGYSITNTYNP